MKKIFFIISILFFLFFLFFINFSSDSVYLYIPQKIFLKTWLLKGIVPFFNPFLFAGTPFMADMNLGNFHPFSLFFLLPYPVSFALFVSTGIFLFMYGFYLFFKRITKNDKAALIGVLLLLFSGNGLLRINNPAVFLVLIHYGFLLYFLKDLDKKSISWPLVLTGMLMTVSGHIQFVMYGHLLTLLVGLIVYRISLRRIILNNAVILLAMCWYYALALPQIIQSTRMTVDPNYLKIGNLAIQQLATLILPYVFGILKDGSLWNAGVKYEILSSILFIPFLTILFLKRKISFIYLIIFFICLISALGYVAIPFLRGASQIFIIIHIFGSLLIVQNYEIIVDFFSHLLLHKRFIFLLFLISAGIAVFTFSPFFAKVFLSLMHAVKKNALPNLFFDQPTVSAIGSLFGYSFVLWVVLFLYLFLFTKRKSAITIVFVAFLIAEGALSFYLNNFFIPQNVITEKVSFPSLLNTQEYRIQSTEDVVPYTGFHTYLGNVLFRPPFSKEPIFIDTQEQRTFKKLKAIFQYLPSNWAMKNGLQTVQGYNALVPKKIALFFKEPSLDYKREYDYIIQRNSLFAQSETGADINVIETSRITMSDPRWEQLGVRYFISDRPLKKYTLISQDRNRYFYENINAPSIFRFIDQFNKEETVKPVYIDPNRMKFEIKKKDVGKKLVIIINPDGFVAKQNNKELSVKREGFNLIIPLKGSGELAVTYSPIYHFRETIKTLLTRQ